MTAAVEQARGTAREQERDPPRTRAPLLMRGGGEPTPRWMGERPGPAHPGGMKYTLPTVLAATAVAAVSPAAALASPLATETHATTVSAVDDTIAWSSSTRDGFKLMLEQSGATAAAKIAPSRTAFDVDLGMSKDGKVLAVYSRAGKLYRYDVAAGTEKPLGIRGTKPTIAGGRLAYVTRTGTTDTLHLRSGGRTRSVYSAPKITQPQLSASRLAYVTDNAPTKLQQIETLRLQTLTGKPKAIYDARSGGANSADVVGPTFDASGKQLFWARRNIGSGSGNRYVRYTIATGKTAYAIGSDQNYSVSYVDPTSGFAVARIAGDDDASAPGGPVIIDTTGALTFDAKP